jgi:crotonobetainyl-CoA:carnitine CoA-transferase CaiB-like acyl-CoA transferase
VATLSMTAYAYLMAGVVAERVGSEHAFIVPWKTFATSDGHLVVAAGNEGQWKALCRAIGRDDLAADERYATMPLRAANRIELYATLDAVFAGQPTDSWVAALDAAGTATAKVQAMDQVFQDPQVLHRDMLLSVEHPTLGSIPQVGHAQKFSGNPAQIRLAPPLLGQHTLEVLREALGCSESELQRLSDDAVIFPAEAGVR